MNNLSFTSRLKNLRSERNWTKTEAAKRIGVSTGAYANWEYGNRSPDYEKIKKLAEVFNVPESYFYENAEEYTESKIESIISKSNSDKYNLNELYYYFNDLLTFITLPLDYPSEEVSETLLDILKILRYADSNDRTALINIIRSTSKLIDNSLNIKNKDNMTEKQFNEYKANLVESLDVWWDNLR